MNKLKEILEYSNPEEIIWNNNIEETINELKTFDKKEAYQFIIGVIVGQDMAQRKVNNFLNKCVSEGLYDLYEDTILERQ